MKKGGIDRAEFERLRVVLARIEQEPDARLDIDTVAALAGMSPAHFHRRFVRLIGCRPGHYIRHRRLDLGAGLLLGCPSWSVLDVAISVGFQSGEAFNRAFRARFADSPARWRRRQLARQKSRNCQKEIHRISYGRAGGHETDDDGVRIVQQPARHLAGLAYVGPYGEPVADFLRTRFYPWCAAQGLHQRGVFGISLDNPKAVPPASCRYEACVIREADEPMHDVEVLRVLPAGPYAQFGFHGTVEQIGQAWHRFVAGWFAASGFEYGGYCFEYYPAGSHVGDSDLHTAFQCTLCIALAPWADDCSGIGPVQWLRDDD